MVTVIFSTWKSLKQLQRGEGKRRGRKTESRGADPSSGAGQSCDGAEAGPGRGQPPSPWNLFHRLQPPGAFREVGGKMTGNNGTLVAGKTQCGTTSVLACKYVRTYVLYTN